MKKIIVGTIAILMLSNCKNESSSVQQTSQRVEYSFTKEGELSLIQGGEVIKKLDIEFAQTPNEHQQGLMDRYTMEENQGMLFIMPENKVHSFWMRNTRIPLDILYVRQDSVVENIVKNAQPMTEYGIPSSSAPTQFVLEVKGGLCDLWGVKAGETKLHWTKTGK